MNNILNFFSKPNHNNKVIFIVEDNETYARSLQAFIQSHFPEVKEIEVFKIGETFLMELHRKPDIVIMDYYLNSMFKEASNGLEIIKRIKAEKLQTDIIVLSGQEKFEVVIDAIKEYGCNYVQKNMDAFSKIENIIHSVFNRKNTNSN